MTVCSIPITSDVLLRQLFTDMIPNFTQFLSDFSIQVDLAHHPCLCPNDLLHFLSAINSHSSAVRPGPEQQLTQRLVTSTSGFRQPAPADSSNNNAAPVTRDNSQQDNDDSTNSAENNDMDNNSDMDSNNDADEEDDFIDSFLSFSITDLLLCFIALLALIFSLQQLCAHIRTASGPTDTHGDVPMTPSSVKKASTLDNKKQTKKITWGLGILKTPNTPDESDTDNSEHSITHNTQLMSEYARNFTHHNP